MWFKNLFVYRLPAGWSMSSVELEAQLSQRTLLPCGAFDMESRGWVFPSGIQRLVHSLNGHHLIALGVDQKLLPGSIIKQVATERAVEMERDQGFPVGRRQMRELRDKVTEELRARAFTRKRMTRAWIDPKNGWFVIDTSGGSRADEVVETMRATLGTFGVQFLETEQSPQAAMAAWLNLGDAPSRFIIDEDLELQAIDQSKATVRYSRHTLDGKEIRAHLSSGKYVTRLGLTWNDRVSFVLTDKLQIKRVKFLHIDKESSEGESSLSNDEQFDIDFTLMAGELTQLLAELTDVLGGEAKALPQAAAA